jgi:cell division protein FtsI/penicillin-binding protein 2
MKTERPRRAKTDHPVPAWCCVLLVLLWIAGIGARAVYLHFQAEKYRLQAHIQQSSFLELASRRGEILDRRLEDLAISRRRVSLPSQGRSPTRVDSPASRPALGHEREEILKRLVSKRQFVSLARKLDAKVRAIQRLELSGWASEGNQALLPRA